MPWLTPDYADPDGKLRMSIHSYVVELQGRRILIDTCVGNDKERRLPIWNRLHTPFLEDLGRAGFPAESIDLVVCTHVHIDHIGWNTRLEGGRWIPTFPNARYVLVREEYDYWCTQRKSRERDTVLRDSIDPIVAAGLVDFRRSDEVICPGLRFVPTPGHTPGHASILLEDAGERALFTGDFLHHPCQVSEPGWSCVFDVDRELAASTRRRMVEQLATESTVVFGTAFVEPNAGRVVRARDSYQFSPLPAEPALGVEP